MVANRTAHFSDLSHFLLHTRSTVLCTEAFYSLHSQTSLVVPLLRPVPMAVPDQSMQMTGYPQEVALPKPDRRRISLSDFLYLAMVCFVSPKEPDDLPGQHCLVSPTGCRVRGGHGGGGGGDSGNISGVCGSDRGARGGHRDVERCNGCTVPFSSPITHNNDFVREMRTPRPVQDALFGAGANHRSLDRRRVGCQERGGNGVGGDGEHDGTRHRSGARNGNIGKVDGDLFGRVNAWGFSSKVRRDTPLKGVADYQQAPNLGNDNPCLVATGSVNTPQTKNMQWRRLRWSGL